MNLSIMIKPASSNCNLRCKYCFYNSLSSHREMPSRGIMKYDTLYDILKKAYEFTGNDTLMLSFQGGEPLLAGKEFFYKLHEYIKDLNVNKCNTFIGIQTNGTLIDEEWCRIFKKGGYLVGLSLDGDKLSDALRVDANGDPTFDKVLANAKLLKKNGVEFNILTVLTKGIAQNIERVYAFYKKQGFKYLQFIPMLKPFRFDENGNVISTPKYDYPFVDKDNDYSLSSEDYKNFLFKCFELYKKDFINRDYTSIRQFDNFIKLVHNEHAEQCGMEGHCNHQFVIEGDGEVYPCDFYCLDKYDMGNIINNDFKSLSNSKVAIDFIKESLVINDKCKECKYFRLCANGCKRERIDIDKCDAYKEFFTKYLMDMKRMS